MKIIILVRILWTSGAQKIAIEEAKTLTKNGHNVKLVFLRKTKSGKNLLPLLDGLNWEVFASDDFSPNPVYSFITGLFSSDRQGEGTVDYNLLRRYPKVLKRDSPDYLICHDRWAGVTGYIAKKKYKIPYSILEHEKVTGKYDIPILGYIGTFIEKKVFKLANRVLGITEKVSSSVRDTYGVNTITDYPGISRTKRVNFKERDNIIISVATWDRNRNPSVYLPILDFLHNYSIFIIGRWRVEEEENNFKKYLANKTVWKDRIKIIDDISEELLLNLYRKSKFSIRFGKEEWGLGTSNIEAISTYTPVIVYDVGLVDLIKQKGGGLALQKLDYGEIAEWITKHDDENDYNILQDELDNISKELTWERHCELLVKINK